MEKKTCNHIGLFAENPASLIDFYVDTLGFERGEVRDVSAELMRPIFGLDADAVMTKLLYGEVTIEVFDFPGIAPDTRSDRTPGLNHWGLNVEDKAAFCDAAEARGAEIIRVPRGDRFILFIRDPEGNRIEVFEY